MEVSSALWAAVLRLASIVAGAVRDAWLVSLGKKAAKADEAEARAKQAQAAANSPRTADELAERLRRGERL